MSAPLSSTTPHGTLRYAPAAVRHGTALCLSGGGFRNALFHLGAVRRLNELGILRAVTTISAVSGGTTLAAHLARTSALWRPNPLSSDLWEREIAAPFRKFTSANASARAVLRGWLPWHWGTNRAVETLADDFEKRHLGATKLGALPDDPKFLFCATDLVSGSQWIFDKSSDEDWTVATAVAVSSWLAPPFSGSPLRRVSLVDGGVCDYLGVEPVWRTHEVLLVSDGGGSYQPDWRTSLIWSVSRLTATLAHHARLAQKRWLLGALMSGSLSGGYWGIQGSPLHYRQDWSGQSIGYSPALARDVIAAMRIDYDACSEAEAAVLENHGYLLADATIGQHLPQLSTVAAPLRVPHPAWLSEQKVREAFRDSTRKRFLGRGRLRALLGREAPSFEPAPSPSGAIAAPPAPQPRYSS